MPEPEPADVALTWLRYAEEDLTAARATLSERGLFVARQSCFSAQQAAEKAIKAISTVSGTAFAFIHDLRRLVDALPPGLRPSADLFDLAWLSTWATAARYPGASDADWADAEKAVGIAETVVADARARLASS